MIGKICVIENNQLPHEYQNMQAFRTPIPEELYPTSYIKEEAKAYLQDAAKSEKPFFSFVSFRTTSPFHTARQILGYV